MSQSALGFIAEPTLAPEAEGVLIRRSIGSERFIYYDPILLLDRLSVEPGKGNIGFPRHPHRGIETLTIVYKGAVNHKDSLGNDDTIFADSVQWMTAGAGIWHSEMIVEHPDGNDSVQLWFNLPACEKFVPAKYSAFSSDSIPEIPVGAAKIRVIAGEWQGTHGPVEGIKARPDVLDIRIPTGESLSFALHQNENAFLYVVAGRIEIEGKELGSTDLAVLNGNSVLKFGAIEDSIVLYVDGAPLNEPVMQYRSVVFNTPQQMGETIAEIEEGTFPNPR
jgi:redox-sensitive bicupin YhaK (pirin superfamily)